MPRNAPPEIVAGASDEAWRRVRLLAVGHERGWFEYVAGTLGIGQHILRISAPGGEWSRRRLIMRQEIEGWVYGVAAAHADIAAVADLGRTPPLLSMQEVAVRLGKSVAGINAKIKAGGLYPLFLARGDLGGRVRYLFADQVDALRDPGDVQAGRRWEAIRALLPPKTRIADLTDWHGPDPSPDPLPLAPASLNWQRLIAALRIGHLESWFRYELADVDANAYVVSVPVGVTGELRRVTLPGGDVLPWVLGHADVHGFPELVAYREGLG